MEAILLIGHGSRAEKASDGMFRIAELIRERGAFPIVEAGFLQLCAPTIEEAVERCRTQGARKIWMVPYFLHSGIHIREDIPEVIRELSERYPNLEMTLGHSLGEDPLLAQVVLNRVQEIREGGS